MSIESEVDVVRKVPVFAKMDVPMLKLLCFSSDRLTYEPGQVMFDAGDVADAAYVLIDGYVDIVRITPTGPVVVGKLGPTQIVGEIGIFGDTSRTATVKATTKVDALRISKEQFMSIVRANPDAAVELIRQLASRLATTTARLTEALATKRE
jgi:CRP-like cAMP-binding protein